MSSKDLRINERIRMSPVRLIGPEGEQIGILPTKEALERAQALGLDLVEVSPNSRPPVCRILDYGKYKYELSKKDRQAKKRQHSFQLKEMRFRPKIDEHDFQFKTKHVRSFLESGSKVKVFVMFRGREMAYTDHGRKVLDRVAEELADVGTVESAPRLEGRHMNMIMAPTADVMKELKQKAEKEKAEEHQAEVARRKAANEKAEIEKAEGDKAETEKASADEAGKDN